MTKHSRALAVVTAALGVVPLALVTPGLVTPANAEPAAGRVLSTASVPGSALSVDVARDGRRAVVLSARGAHGRVLTSYALRSGRTTRLGSVAFRTTRPVWDEPFVRIDRSGEVAFMQVGRSVAVYDVQHRTPRRTALLRGSDLFPGVHGRFLAHAVLFSPDRTRAYVTTWERVRVLDLTHPRHPSLGALGTTPNVVGDDLTPDGTRLLARGHETVDGPPEQPEVYRALVGLYDLDPATGAPTLARQVRVDVPGWSADDSTNAEEVVAAPSGSAAYVRASDYGPYHWSFPPESAVVRVRLAELSTDARLTDAPKSVWQLRPDPAGSRLYVTEGNDTDENEHYPRRLRWTTPDLEGRHRVVDVGDVMDAAFSPGGSTRGHLYVLSRRQTLRLRELRLP